MRMFLLRSAERVSVCRRKFYRAAIVRRPTRSLAVDPNVAIALLEGSARRALQRLGRKIILTGIIDIPAELAPIQIHPNAETERKELPLFFAIQDDRKQFLIHRFVPGRKLFSSFPAVGKLMTID